MSTNPEEKQNFEDLRGILNYMYNFANYYYNELKKAQDLNARKDSEISTLKISNEQNIKAKNNEITNLKNKIGVLENNILTQGKNFQQQLREYGDYNNKLVLQLETIERDLKTQKERLDERERKLKENERQFEQARAAFEDERKKFQAEESDLRGKAAGYESLRQAAAKFDAEKRELQQKLQGEIDRLNGEINNKNSEIETLKKEKEGLNKKVYFAGIDKQTLQEKNKRLQEENENLRKNNGGVPSQAENLENEQQPQEEIKISQQDDDKDGAPSQSGGSFKDFYNDGKF